MAEARIARIPPVRSDFEVTLADAGHIGAVERPLSLWERISNIDAVRRIFILVLLFRPTGLFGQRAA